MGNTVYGIKVSNGEINAHRVVVNDHWTARPLWVAAPGSRTSSRQSVYGLELLTHGERFPVFKRQGKRIYEIRVRDPHGEWSDWQAIVGPFMIVQLNRDETAFQDMDRVGLWMLRHNYEIRVSGRYFRGIGGNKPQVLLKFNVEGEDFRMVANIDPRTGYVEFDPRGNAMAAFEDRCKEWWAFEKRYYQYDSEGIRI